MRFVLLLLLLLALPACTDEEEKNGTVTPTKGVTATEPVAESEDDSAKIEKEDTKEVELPRVDF